MEIQNFEVPVIELSERIFLSNGLNTKRVSEGITAMGIMLNSGRLNYE